MADYGKEDDTTLKFHSKATMNELVVRYNDLKKLENILQTTKNVKKLQE